MKEAKDSFSTAKWFLSWITNAIAVKKNGWVGEDQAMDAFNTAATIAKASASTVAGDVPKVKQACLAASKNAMKALESAYTTALAGATNTLARSLHVEATNRK